MKIKTVPSPQTPKLLVRQRVFLAIMFFFIPLLTVLQLVYDLFIIMNETIWDVYCKTVYEFHETLCKGYFYIVEIPKAVFGFKTKIVPVIKDVKENS